MYDCNRKGTYDGVAKKKSIYYVAYAGKGFKINYLYGYDSIPNLRSFRLFVCHCVLYMAIFNRVVTFYEFITYNSAKLRVRRCCAG